jgi:hypothetical protein
MIKPSTDLFGSEPSSTPDGKPARWLLATNQRNLLYMLAAGLVMSPKGFGEKYYGDTLRIFPGWVPLFLDGVPSAPIEQSVSERNHLMPCLAEIDLSSLSGKVMAICGDCVTREVKFPDEIDGTEQVLLVPAPLPISNLKSIIFETRADKVRCEADAQDFGNVPLSLFKREVSARLFSSKSDLDWPPENILLPDHDMPMDGPFAAGGMMAMLLQMANLGDIGISSYHLAFDNEDKVAETISDPMISALGTWGRMARVPDNADVLQSLFWGAVDKLVAWRSSQSSQSALDVLLGHLELAGEQLDDRMKLALSKLAKDLRALAGFSDSTITELFERHPKSFSRVMTLFFLREECAELLEFRHPMLNETDYVAASILFAARDGWLGLPLELRDHPGLQDAVSHRMAAMAHRMASTGIGFGVPPNRPTALRELFLYGSRGWTKAQEEAALILARDCKWDCIQTRVSLGNGNYRLSVDGKGMHILIGGEAKAVETEVDSEQFFVHLAREHLSSKLERKVRDLLEK